MVRQILQRISSASQPRGASSSGSERSDEDPSSRLNLSRASSILHGEQVRRKRPQLRPQHWHGLTGSRTHRRLSYSRDSRSWLPAHLLT